MVAELDQPGVPRPVRLLASPVGLSRTLADSNRLPGAALATGYDSEQIEALLRSGAIAGPRDEVRAEQTFLG